MTNADSDRQKLIRLHELLSETYSLTELQALCFYLGLDYENLPGSTKSAKILELITYLERRSELQRLLDEVKGQRPSVTWPEFAPGTEDASIKEKNRREPVSQDQVGGDKITAGDISDVRGAGIGEKAQGLSAGDVVGSIYQAQGDITLGRALRDEQYETALNWDGQRRMRGYDLAGRDLSGLNLWESDLRNARLQRADLSGTDLSGADLSGAKLQGAKLKESDLMGATLDKADLSDAELQGADLSGVTDLRRAKSLAGARYDKDTTWPADFDPHAFGAILVDYNNKPVEDRES